MIQHAVGGSGDHIGNIFLPFTETRSSEAGPLGDLYTTQLGTQHPCCKALVYRLHTSRVVLLI
jgi:hypothetical protein